MEEDNKMDLRIKVVRMWGGCN